MTTPVTMNSILGNLRQRIEDAERDCQHSSKLAINSYGAGYDRGFATALREIWREITGDEIQLPD